jgi:hypothetical protein
MPCVALGGSGAAARTAAELTRYRSGVLTWLDTDVGPSSTRVRPTVDPDGRLLLDDDAAFHPGPASLLCHSHDERLWSQQSFVTVGSLARDDERWVFVPERFIDGASTRPGRVLGMFRDARSTASRYLTKRGLPRPAVD